MNDVAEVQQHETQALAQRPTPAHMLQTAIERGVDMAPLEKLMELQARWESNEARKAFVKAMSEFKANPPKVFKDRLVAYQGTRYTHASLAAGVDAVVAGLSEHGLSHRWDVEQNGSIKVTCVLTHELGHSESVSMSAPADDSGKKNAIQQIASTITYLERYTLMAATGLAAKDMADDDGRSASTETITEDQAAELKQLLQETDSDVAAFLKAMGGAPSVDELPAGQYKRAKVALNRKKVQQQERD